MLVPAVALGEGDIVVESGAGDTRVASGSVLLGCVSGDEPGIGFPAGSLSLTASAGAAAAAILAPPTARATGGMVAAVFSCSSRPQRAHRLAPEAFAN
jgi:hypothetical protein